MNLSELRIGNFIHGIGFDSEYIKVVYVSVPLVYEHPTGAIDSGPWQPFEPIILTEEWLLKFGFEMRGIQYAMPSETDEQGMFKKEKWPFFLDTDIGPGWLLLPNKGTTWVVNHDRIKYVHQLQNLYFALTGEELTIKQ